MYKLYKYDIFFIHSSVDGTFWLFPYLEVS